MKLYAYKGKCNLSGERIRLARERAGWSQEQLAAKLQVEDINVTQKAVSRMETGIRVIPDYELPALAKVLQVSILWLLAQEGPATAEG